MGRTRIMGHGVSDDPPSVPNRTLVAQDDGLMSDLSDSLQTFRTSDRDESEVW